MTDDRYGLPENIALVDDYHLGRPQVVGTYVLLGENPVIVDPGPASVLPNLETGLRRIGLEFSDLHGIVLSHIHLDHAGRHRIAGALLSAPESLCSSSRRSASDRAG
jgi:glyoxylase-like metal-dependent hydrolase (beta-lactamase superfamily II)